MRFFRNRLPHWLVAEHSYFVTLCRKGCLPASVFADLSRPGATSPASWFDSFHRLDTHLNAPTPGPRNLTDPSVAAKLLDNFEWLRGRGWRIWAGCLMPSHIHLVMRNTVGRNDRLSEDLGQFKNYTGREANRLLGSSGTFWQRECFDHWCRDSEDWLRFSEYTIQNPVKAKLAETWHAWPWTVVDPELKTILTEEVS